ncbi:ribosomal protection-like ABC-F family protein [Cohnella candidum]|uniref:ABC transporter ATP-binding protein n=1 Tax=Cohnella candidum TaxID=2674991 RepID=A0A3G3JXT4_9BACL|nr:ABC-F family ATP-binding cassette domain-containing protein [Cohnella candidum]AYQ72329.1 ABC transporter ATP-binding protein [Cohnella candidum]
MILLEANGIELSVGDRKLFSAERLIVRQGDRIGLVGANGAGKTTLMQVLAGRLQPDQGSVNAAVPCVFVPQMKQHSSPLSGGEATWKQVEAALQESPDILLADEPTIHLDMAHIRELEKRLRQHGGGMVIISHDRAFLDGICTRIWSLDNARVSVYEGNYAEYEKMRDLEKRQHALRYEAYTEKKRQLEEAISAKTQKAAGMLKPPKRMSTSESRLYKAGKGVSQKGVHQTIKALETRVEKLEKVEKPRELPTIKLGIPGGREFVSPTALRVERLSASFGDRTLWRDVGFALKKGSKTALIGANGSGKTTLVKRILESGEGVFPAPGAKIGYFSQNLDVLKPERSVLENVSETAAHPDATVRLVLARLLFRGDDVYKPVGVLSGGERVKAAFAKIFLGEINMLLMDEPTSFLDIPSIEALEELLAAYEGTLLFVSHDRRFVERVAGQVLDVRNGTVAFFEGPLTDYLSRSSPAGQGRPVLEEELLALEMAMSEVLGKLGAPGLKAAEAEELDARFRMLVQRRNELKKALPM